MITLSNIQNFNWEVVISVLIALLSSLVAFISSIRNRKAENLRTIICGQRLKTLEEFRTNYTNLYNLMRIESVKLINDENKQEKLEQLISASSKFECTIKTIYTIEKNLYDKVKNIIKQIVNYANNQTLVSDYYEQVELFYHECQIYDWAYWEYVQQLALTGKYLNSDENFDDIYKKVKNSIQEKF